MGAGIRKNSWHQDTDFNVISTQVAVDEVLILGSERKSRRVWLPANIVLVHCSCQNASLSCWRKRQREKIEFIMIMIIIIFYSLLWLAGWGSRNFPGLAEDGEDRRRAHLLSTPGRCEPTAWIDEFGAEQRHPDFFFSFLFPFPFLCWGL